MDVDELRRTYNREQRINIHDPSFRRIQSDYLVRHVDRQGQTSFISYSALNADNADAIIREQLDYFARLGHNLEWKYYSYDTPKDLKARLIKHGFDVGEDDAVLILPVAHLPEQLTQPVTYDIRRITKVEDLEDVNRVQQHVWDEDLRPLTARLAYEMQRSPGFISIYIAYVDGIPASYGRIHFPRGNAFASLWGGATVPAYRRRGLYTQLLIVRAQEAKRRGIAYLTVEANSMSRPILEKYGFICIGYSNACYWAHQAK